MIFRHVAAAAVAACILALGGGQASAQDKFYTFRSVLPPPSPGWCLDVQGAKYESGAKLHLWDCLPQTNQAFGFLNESNLTIGGLCLDSFGTDGKQPGEEGDAVGIAECNGTDHQVWALQPIPGQTGTVAIASGDLCVTVDGPNGARDVPLVLRTCDQSPAQSFTTGTTKRPVYVVNNPVGSFTDVATVTDDSEFYVWQGRRYCWYGSGWNNAGWYWCGYHLRRGLGWGGPLGWHFWQHHGHPVKKHPFAEKNKNKNKDGKKGDGKKAAAKKMVTDINKKAAAKKMVTDIKKSDAKKAAFKKLSTKKAGTTKAFTKGPTNTFRKSVTKSPTLSKSPTNTPRLTVTKKATIAVKKAVIPVKKK